MAHRDRTAGTDSQHPSSYRSASSAPKRGGRGAFWLRRIHSFTGVLPAGLLLCCYLWTESKALGGPEIYQAAVAPLYQLSPVWQAVILLPLAYHGLYGTVRAVTARYDVSRTPSSRFWSQALQRSSGLIALAFIAYHLWSYWLPVRLGQLSAAELYPLQVARLSATTATGGIPLLALGCMIGVAACSFHLANGLTGFCAARGLLASRRRRWLGAVAFGVLGLALFLLGASTTIYFATGKRLAALHDYQAAGAQASECPPPAAPAASSAAAAEQDPAAAP